MSMDLEAAERASGATFARIAEHPRPLPARFSVPDSEWKAVRQHAGVLDAGFRGLLRVTGGDRISFLQGMVSNDVVGLHPGCGTYAAVLTQQAKIVSDVRVYVLDEEIWLDMPVTRVAAVRESLERYIVADDVELAHDADCQPLIVVEGPESLRVMGAVFEKVLDELPALAHRELRIGGASVRCIAVSHTGEAGYMMVGAPQHAAALWERCAAIGTVPVGMDALQVLRIESGIPWYGADMDDATLIGEVGLSTAISYTKGCYLGQEVVERVAARGQVQRKLVGIVCDGQAVPPRAAKLCRDGKEVGWVTSATWSPACQAVIALGYARRECWEPGYEVSVLQAGGATTTARIATLPFYKPA